MDATVQWFEISNAIVRYRDVFCARELRRESQRRVGRVDAASTMVASRIRSHCLNGPKGQARAATQSLGSVQAHSNLESAHRLQASGGESWFRSPDRVAANTVLRK